jgi:hypothetical protein
MPGNSMSRENPGIKRTGLMLAAVALAFFLAIMLKYWLSK